MVDVLRAQGQQEMSYYYAYALSPAQPSHTRTCTAAQLPYNEGNHLKVESIARLKPVVLGRAFIDDRRANPVLARVTEPDMFHRRSDGVQDADCGWLCFDGTAVARGCSRLRGCHT